MPPLLLYEGMRCSDSDILVVRFEQPKDVALGSRLSMSKSPTFGLVWEVRIVKGTRGIVARVEKLVLCQDGSYSVEVVALLQSLLRSTPETLAPQARLGEEIVVRQVTEVRYLCTSSSLVADKQQRQPKPQRHVNLNVSLST